MNAKEEIILELKARIAHYHNYKRHNSYDSEGADRQIELFTNLIAATESAIFDLPSWAEIDKAGESNYAVYETGFCDGCNFILNYKAEL